MNLRPRLHDLYIGRVVLATVLLTWAVLLGFDLMMAVSGQLGDLARAATTSPPRWRWWPTAHRAGPTRSSPTRR